jgi:hypothetical protein
MILMQSNKKEDLPFLRWNVRHVKESDTAHIGSRTTVTSNDDPGIILKTAREDCAIFSPDNHGNTAAKKERIADQGEVEKEGVGAYTKSVQTGKDIQPYLNTKS